MTNEDMFDYLDLQGRTATVALGNIARFRKAFHEQLGGHVGYLHLRAGADVLTRDPDGVHDRLRALKEAGQWNGFLR